MLNNAVPANVVSRASSGYSPDWKGSLPPALDRYEEDLISHKPDLAIIAYGLNDSRCGNPVEDFIRDYEQIVRDVRERTSASVVLVGPYWNTQYDPVLWFGLDKRPNFGKFDKAGRDLVVAYIEPFGTSRKGMSACSLISSRRSRALYGCSQLINVTTLT